jgi:polyisoprenoid-binding protein YceI
MTFRTLALLGSTLLSVPALASDWTIDSAHSEADFKVRHMGISYVNGTLGTITGTIHLDESNISKSNVAVSIDVSQIETREPKRNGHLKSPDFFDVAKYPAVTFKSTHVTQESAGKLKVTGDLTMHGVTKSVVLSVEGPSAPVKDPWGNARIAATGTTQVDRRDYGLVWNKPLEAGAGVLVGDDVAVAISIEAVAAKK